MAANRQNIADLIWQHRAIRAHMKFVTESFKSVATQSDRVMAQSIQLNDLMRLYLWPLYDFREAIRRHIMLDERIFTPGTSVEDIAREHEAIQKQADSAIQLAEKAVYDKLNQEELNRSALNIRESFKRISGLIEAHTAKEDRLLEQIQKDL